jgi:hypothetical protein
MKARVEAGEERAEIAPMLQMAGDLCPIPITVASPSGHTFTCAKNDRKRSAPTFTPTIRTDDAHEHHAKHR